MRKLTSVLFLASLIFTAGLAQAQHYHYGPRYYPGYHHGYHWHPQYGWVLPTIVGGVIGYEIAKSQQPPVVVQQQPVIVQQPSTTTQTQTCSPWIERQEADGRITRTRTCQ